ncbi:MAG TPA: hypothetical protein VMR39_25080, partial [Sphingobium sp.]|nr:hypothetical protein [Sphingobium sp.]
MLITARSKGLLGVRPDASTSAHSGAQDLGLLAAPPLAFGASLSPSSATPTFAQPNDGHRDESEAQAILASPSFAAPFETVTLAANDLPLPQAVTSLGSFASPSAPEAAITEPHAPAFAPAPAPTPTAEAATGSSGGAIPNAGLPAAETASPSAAAATIPAAPSPEVAPLVAAVEFSAANLQAAVTALLGQIGAQDQSGTLPEAIEAQGDALSQGIAALTDGLA